MSFIQSKYLCFTDTQKEQTPSSVNNRLNLPNPFVSQNVLPSYTSNQLFKKTEVPNSLQAPFPSSPPTFQHKPVSYYSREDQQLIRRYKRQLNFRRRPRQSNNIRSSPYGLKYVTIHDAPQPQYGISFRTRQWVDCKFIQDECGKLEEDGKVVECQISRFR